MTRINIDNLNTFLTVVRVGGVRPAQQYRIALIDPVLDRQISLEYRVQALPIIA